MSECPFNRDLLDRLLAGEISGEERDELARHLGEDCPECESFFAGLSATEEEIILKFGLARESEGESEPALSPEVRQKIFDAMPPPMVSGSAEITDLTPWIKKRWSRRTLALAASLLLAVSLLFLYQDRQPEAESYLKGGPEKPAKITLQFLVLSPAVKEGAEPTLVRGVNRAVYPSRDRVLFRYQLDQPAFVYIERLDQAGKGEVVYPAKNDPDVKRAPGVYDVNQGDDLLAYPLELLADWQTFCAVCYTRGPVKPEKALAHAAKLQDPNPKLVRSSLFGISSMDCFKIKVDKSWQTKSENGP